MRTGLYLQADIDTLYFDNFAVFGRARQAEMLAPEMRERLAGIDPYAAAHQAIADAGNASLLNQLLYADMRTYLHELLMKQDQMSMAASIESRVPFLDHPLVEFTARLPDRLKLRGTTTKYILRQAMKDALPPEILSRRKMGFPVPVGSWFRGPYRHVIQDCVLGERAAGRGIFARHAVERIVREHDAGEIDHSERLWSLVNLELWHRIFLDGEAPADMGLDAPAFAAAR